MRRKMDGNLYRHVVRKDLVVPHHDTGNRTFQGPGVGFGQGAQPFRVLDHVPLDEAQPSADNRIGLEAGCLAADTGVPKTSLMRMLGPNGNPRADNLGSILKALWQHTGLHIVAHVEPGPEAA